MDDNKVYTVIDFYAGYSDSWDYRTNDFCKGEPAFLKTHVFTEKQDAIEMLATCSVENPDGEQTLLINGYTDNFISNYFYQTFGISSYDFDEIVDAAWNLAQVKREQLVIQKRLAAERVAEQARIDLENKRIAAANAAEAFERAEFQRLQAKYGR